MEKQVKTKAEFEVAVAKGQVVVDFWATWCGPCQLMGERLTRELLPNAPQITVVKVNVDEAPELAAAFGVMSIPTLLCYQNGVQVASFVGVTSVAELRAAFA